MSEEGRTASTNGWSEYKNLFKEQMSEIRLLREELQEARTDIAVLKERMRATSVIYGILGGAIPVAIMIAIRLWGA